MLKHVMLVVTVFALLCPSMQGRAEYKKVRVVGSVKCSQTKHASSATQRKALEDAKKKALNKYLASLDSQRVRLLDKVKDDLYKNLDTYVIEVIPMDDGYWENGYWNVNAEASINEAQIEEMVNRFAQRKIQGKDEAYLAFVFVARETDSVMKYKDTVRDNFGANETSGAKNKASSKDSAQGKKIGNDTINESANSKNSESESVNETNYQADTLRGGSVEKKSDSIKYKTYTSDDLDNKISEIFNKAEFAVVPSFEAGIDTNGFTGDFITKNQVSPQTQMAAVNAARSKGISYLAVGSLDVGEQLVDPATGMQKAYVRVNAFIWDLNGKFVRKVCSVGPVQYSGTGEDPMVAKTNALINAGTAAAKDLVDQLRAKQSL